MATVASIVTFRFRRARSLRGLAFAANVAFGLACALALAAAAITVGPRLIAYQALPVLTGSMEPAIPTGSLAVVTPVRAEDLGVGDVITFHHPQVAGAYVTHRIAAIEGAGASRTFVTQGDANALPDGWQVKATGTGWRYAFGVPVAGAVIVGYENSPLRFALFAIPLLALAALALFEIWRPRPREVRPAEARAA